MSEYIAEKELECFGYRRVMYESEKFYIACNLIYRRPRLICEECNKKSSKYEIFIVRLCYILVCILIVGIILTYFTYFELIRTKSTSNIQFL